MHHPAHPPAITLVTLRRLLVIGGLLGAVAAVAAGLVISYRQSENDCFQELSAEVHLWADGTRYVFDVAQGTLTHLAQTLPGKTPEEIRDSLRQAVFDRPIFREAGWIVDGQLVIASYGMVKPPRQIAPDDLKTAPDNDGLYFIPPTKTYLGGTSLIINKRVDEHTIVDVLISPNSLLVPLSRATKSATTAVFLMRADGLVLLSSEGADNVGFPPSRIPAEGRSRHLPGLILCQRVGDTPVYAVAFMPRRVLLAHWKKRVPTYGLLAVLAAGLFLAGTWQMRRKVFGLKAEIREAAVLQQFQPLFQPVINVETGACEGAEILMRWVHPRLGVILPALFIPEAEASGLIGLLTLSMLRREAAGLRAFLHRYPQLHLKLNLSTCMLDDADFVKHLIEALGDESLLLRFHFELTESVSADDVARQRLQEFKALGISLAVDDFGTGYSNLRYLKDLPFDYLKIDKAFVDGISSATESSGLIDSIIGIGKNCGLLLIAEGVEHEEQLQYLRRCGVQSAQGYYISRPISLEDFEQWLKQREG